ncbi:MAG: alpha-L-fucosidase [Bryobacteraceae bacterium]|jgi:alpha-L-fucosidase
MRVTRRSALRSLAGGAVGAPAILSANGKTVFSPTWESLKQYRCPDWFRDAKFGTWAHWGPQGGPKQGDWYARNMYLQGTRQNKYHVEHFGHPSKVGYKDVIPLWTAKNWEPETLIRRYKKAGAKYFFSLGVHCDNFDCWNSRHHRWNAVNFGPKKDVVGTWRDAARSNGLRFGVSEHLAWSWGWFNVNKGSDKTGPYAGVPYDGNDPAYQDLYFPPHADTAAQYPQDAPEWWKQAWLARVKDLVDQHRPDVVYTDGGAFGQVGLELIAHYYNASMEWHGGRLEGVYTLKNHTAKTKLFGEYQEGATLLDVERGVVGDIRGEPWQTCTCIGQWFYWEGFKYRRPRDVIHMLIDVVSKNGNLLLSFPQLPDGTLDTEEEGILEEITRWMAVNGEAIFATRPWKKYGEGPATIPGGILGERSMKPFTPADLRFTTKKDSLFVFCLGWPEGDIEVRSLGTAAGLWQKRIQHVRLLGSEEEIEWSADAERLRIRRPNRKPCDLAVAFEIL